MGILLILSFFLYGCTQNVNPGNYPLEPDGPAPNPHEGIFVSEHGSLIFNGDGESITLKIDSQLEDLFELPAGEYSGTYVFLSGDLPPNGSFPIRYDAAHELRIDLDVNGTEYSKVFDVGIASEDGKSSTAGLNTVSPEKIPLLFDDEDRFLTILFVKE